MVKNTSKSLKIVYNLLKLATSRSCSMSRNSYCKTLVPSLRLDVVMGLTGVLSQCEPPQLIRCVFMFNGYQIGL